MEGSLTTGSGFGLESINKLKFCFIVQLKEIIFLDNLVDILTFADTDDVILFGEQQRQTLHQQQSFMVAQSRSLPVVEHLVQRRRLNLRSHQDAVVTSRWLKSEEKTLALAYHLHCVAEQQPLSCDGGDLVHQTVLPGKEALQTGAERAAGCHAGLVQLVQPLHHCTGTTRF